jgi:hypothetical protein
MGNKVDESYAIRRKKVKHNEQAESVRSVFGEPKAKEHDPKDFKI